MVRRRNEKREAYWRGVIADQEQSGLTVSEFCRKRSLAAGSFFNWRRKLQDRGSVPGIPGKFVTIDVTAPADFPAEGGFELILANGRRLVVPSRFCASSLRALLAVLEENASC